MLSRFAFLLPVPLVVSVSLVGSAVSAQNLDPTDNAFFQFDFILYPLAIKWACGGGREQDLSHIETLIVAFPEDAERAGLRSTVAELSELAAGPESLPQFLGAELDDQKVEQLCTAAQALNIDWLTPDIFIAQDERGISGEQELAWDKFFAVVEAIQ